MKINEIENLEEIEMKILTFEVKINLREWGIVYMKIVYIKILTNREDKVRKVIKDIKDLKFKIEELGAMGVSKIILVTRFLQHLSNSENSNIILYSLDWFLTNSSKQVNLDINHRIPKL